MPEHFVAGAIQYFYGTFFFLFLIDQALLLGVSISSHSFYVFRYIFDFLIVLDKTCPVHYNEMVDFILKQMPMSFQPTMFLDLALKSDHVCCTYMPHIEKELLPCDSKTAKQFIALHCLHSTLRRSCLQMMQTVLGNQIGRLENAGFPWPPLACRCRIFAAEAD